MTTEWGPLRHYWVATKIALAVTVIVAAVQLGNRLVRRSLPDPVEESGTGC